MTEYGEGAGSPFVVTARDIIEDRRSLGEVLRRKFLLYLHLPGEEPIKGIVELLLIGVDDGELLGKGCGMPEPCRRQLGRGVDEPLRNHGDDEITLPASLGGEERIEADRMDRPEDGLDMAVGQGTFDPERLFRADQELSPQEPPEGIDLLARPVGEIGERPLTDLLAFPPRFPQENRRPRATVGDPFDMHDFFI